MTPELKAKELINRYLGLNIHGTSSMNAANRAIKCAIICVEEILGYGHEQFLLSVQAQDYWQSVITYLKNK